MMLLAVSSVLASEPKTKTGDKSLQFTIGGLGNFDVGSAVVATSTFLTGATPPNSQTGSAKLTGFGGKWYLSEDMALRGAVNLSKTSLSQSVAGGENEASFTTIGLAPGVEWHFVKSGSVTAYWGGTGQIGWAQISAKQAGGTEQKLSATVLGLAAILGVEFFAWENISFGAEYQLGFNHTSTKSESGASSTNGPSFTTWGIQNYAVSLGVYF